MKNSSKQSGSDSSKKVENEILKNDYATNISNELTEGKLIAFNNALISSLPFPAMLVRHKDRIIISANNMALNLGTKIGGYCWRGFGKSLFISDEDKKIAAKYPKKVPENFHIKCAFCLGDKCTVDSPLQNNPEVKAFGRIWNVYWIRLNDDIFLHYLIDITESKLLEDSLRESVWFLKHTQQVAMIGTYNLDLLKETWVSSEVLDSIFGFEPQQSKTLEDWFSCIHPDMKEVMINYYKNEVLAKKSKFDKEYKIIRRNDGTVRWVHSIGYLNFDENNKPIKLIGAIHDITERKQEQSESIRSFKFTEVLLKSLPIPVFMKDPSGKYTGCNEAFSKQMGITNENIKGKTVLDILPANQASFYHEMEQKILTNGDFQTFESQLTDKYGKTIDVIFAKSIFQDEESKTAGTIGMYIDISKQKKVENELRESEHKYKLLSENVTDGIFTCRDGYLEYINLSMSRIFGYEHSYLEGLKLSQLIIPTRRTEFESFISFDKKTDQISNIEIECKRGDNTTVFVEFFLNYVANENLTYGVIHDITEKRLMQEKNIVKAIIQTEEKERASFSKELHDGLGPLLSTIKLYLQWSLRPKSNVPSKEIIHKAEEVLEEALIAVKEISNKLSPHLLINYGLSSAVQDFAMKLVETHAIRINFESNLTRRIELEIEVALYRAIIECVNNTLKYAKAKHIYIKLNDENTQIHLQYKDDGKGFDITKVLIEKRGLGLFNLQNRIQTIGGEISMFSKPHRGVTYNIKVPIK